MIKELIKLSNHLDAKGLRKEADYLDAVINKVADKGELATGAQQILEGSELLSCHKPETLPCWQKGHDDGIKYLSIRVENYIRTEFSKPTSHPINQQTQTEYRNIIDKFLKWLSSEKINDPMITGPGK